MQLEIKLPELNERSFDTAKGTKLVLDYMYQLNRQLRYLLNHLDEENLSKEVAEKIGSIEGLRKDVDSAVKQDSYYANNIIVNNNIGQLNKDVAIQAETITLQGQKIDLNTISISENGERISSAEIRLNSAEANILLKVDRDGVISAINLSPEVITIQSKRINLVGYVTAQQLEAELANIELSFNERIYTKTLQAESVGTGEFTLSGTKMSKINKTFLTSAKINVGTATAKVMHANGSPMEITYVTSVTISNNDDDIYYVGYY